MGQGRTPRLMQRCGGDRQIKVGTGIYDCYQSANICVTCSSALSSPLRSTGFTTKVRRRPRKARAGRLVHSRDHPRPSTRGRSRLRGGRIIDPQAQGVCAVGVPGGRVDPRSPPNRHRARAWLRPVPPRPSAGVVGSCEREARSTPRCGASASRPSGGGRGDGVSPLAATNGGGQRGGASELQDQGMCWVLFVFGWYTWGLRAHILHEHGHAKTEPMLLMPAFPANLRGR